MYPIRQLCIFAGLTATIIALTVGLSTLKTGNQKLSQKMMRWRVGAQGFTLFALIAGVGYQSMSKKDATKTKLKHS